VLQLVDRRAFVWPARGIVGFPCTDSPTPSPLALRRHRLLRPQRCLYAHGADEMREDALGGTPGNSPATNDRYKTRMCKHWVTSVGQHCPHGEWRSRHRGGMLG
jgi:hypothetical protein